NLRNTASEADHFIGLDSRHFFVRLRDPSAAGTVQVSWRTAFISNGTNDDVRAQPTITLTETAANSHVFISKALMLVTDDTDKQQAANSGLPAGNPDVGDRTSAQSNHRLRKITVDDTHPLDSSSIAEYTPTGVTGPAIAIVNTPVFNRSPEDRRRLRIHLVNVRSTVGGVGILTAARRDLVKRTFQSIYAVCGIFAEIDEILLDPPASCIGWRTRYPTDPLAVDPSVEGFSFPGGVNLVASTSQTDLVNAVRALPAFNANDIYIIFLARIYAQPIPAPPGPGLVAGDRGQSFPDAWTAAGAVTRGFTFVAVNNAPTNYTEVHEATHMTTNLRNSAGGHFDLGAANVTDRRNLMHNGTIDGSGILDTKRLWNDRFTNASITPSVIPPQIDAIRRSRFIRNF
ncbi:MAG TPA: hypothetical protein V6C57_05870, partial [Coleofasciculaceae cyanobacterium]